MRFCYNELGIRLICFCYCCWVFCKLGIGLVRDGGSL